MHAESSQDMKADIDRHIARRTRLHLCRERHHGRGAPSRDMATHCAPASAGGRGARGRGRGAAHLLYDARVGPVRARAVGSDACADGRDLRGGCDVSVSLYHRPGVCLVD